MERRLAAILAADVVGYSRLMELDEAGTLATLKERRREILSPLVAQHHGRIVKMMGDGVLVEFASAVNAVACAVELQNKMAEAGAGQQADRRIVLRVGVNLGDVVVEGGDLFGDGVIVAVRLQALAEPGGIYISRGVHDQVEKKLALAYEDLGPREVKNMARPIHVFRIGLDLPEMGGVSGTARATKPSIAILPFTNLSADRDQQYLSDGITEDIITELSRYKELFVIARNSSFQYRDKSVDIKRVGRELGVEYLVEGSLRKAGERLRITIQLIEASTGNHLWAEKYDRELEDVFAIQDEVTQTVAATLVGRVARSGAERARRKPTGQWAAYDCFLQAQEHGSKYELEAAITLLRRALELDPEYAQAYAMLADSYATNFFFDADEIALQTALRYAQKALSIDDNDGLCHYAMGFTQLFCRRYDVAGAHLARAVALNPNSVLFASHHALWLACVGRGREALQNLDIAARRDPLKQSYFYQIRAFTLFVEKRYEEASQTFNQVIPQQYWDHAFLAATNVYLGREQEARAEVAEVIRMRPNCSISRIARVSALKNSADLDHLFAGLRKAGLPE